MTLVDVSPSRLTDDDDDDEDDEDDDEDAARASTSLELILPRRRSAAAGAAAAGATGVARRVTRGTALARGAVARAHAIGGVIVIMMMTGPTAAVSDAIMSRALARAFASHAASTRAHDVVIAGGGVAGAALACALKSNPRTAALSVVVIDRARGRGDDELARALAPLAANAPPEARCVALTPRSMSFLEHGCGSWTRVEESRRARAFDVMQVWDGVGGGHVTYDARECGADALGRVVETNVVLAALETRMRELGVERMYGKTIAEASASDEDAPGTLTRVTVVDAASGSDAKTDAGGELELHARLVVAADGPKSAMRKMAKIKVGGWGYGQRAVCGTVKTEHAHSTAWQRFLPTGPIALLPIGDGTYSNVVWTTTPDEAKRLTEEITAEEFAKEVNDALQGYGAYKSAHQEDLNRFAALRAVEDAAEATFKPLARVMSATLSRAVGVPPVHRDEDHTYELAPRFQYPPECTSAGEKSERGSFPLSTHHAFHLVKPRLALIGDAAHVVHPLGGQGLNLGLRDAELLADAVSEAAALGQDIGSINALKPYARASVAANVPMMAALDGLQKLFSVDAYPVALARSIGLAAVNAAAPIRRNIAFYAMGGA